MTKTTTSIDSILNKINKDFGLSNAVFKAGENVEALTKKRIPTASDALNSSLFGGLAEGGIVEIAGEAGSGKTSLFLETVALNQKIANENGEECFCGIFETESSYDSIYAKELGVDLDQFVYWDQRDVCAEDGLDVLISLIKSGKFKIIGVNSVAGLIPTQEEEGNLSDNKMALLARLMSRALRQIATVASSNKCTVIMINQLRETLSLYGGAESSGGRALRYYAGIRVYLNRVKLQSGDPISQEEGMKVNCYVKKNRFAYKNNPLTSCSYYVRYESGIDNMVTLPQIFVEKGILKASGAWLSVLDKDGNVETIDGILCKWNGKTKFIDAIRENEILLNELKSRA